MAPSSWPVPPLASPAALAEWLGLTHRLDAPAGSLTLYEPSLFAFLADPHASPKVVGHEITLMWYAGRVEEAARLYVDYWTSEGEFDRMPAEKRVRMIQRMSVSV